MAGGSPEPEQANLTVDWDGRSSIDNSWRTKSAVLNYLNKPIQVSHICKYDTNVFLIGSSKNKMTNVHSAYLRCRLHLGLFKYTCAWGCDMMRYDVE